MFIISSNLFLLYLRLSFHENLNIIVADGFYNSGHPSNKSDLKFSWIIILAIFQINLCEQLFSHQIEDHRNYCQTKKKINTSKNQLKITFDLSNEKCHL